MNSFFSYIAFYFLSTLRSRPLIARFHISLIRAPNFFSLSRTDDGILDFSVAVNL